MVYLDVYNSIFQYLEDIGAVDEVFKYSEELIGHLFGSIKSNEMMNDVVVEIALFNYIHENTLLIDFLYENLYPNLNKNDKKEFDIIRESKRLNLKFNKKEKINQLDTKGLDLYDFHFHDMDSNKPVIVVSSTALDELGYNINARLIKNPNHEGKFSIIGGIFERNVAETIQELSALSMMKKSIDETKSHINDIFSFSKGHRIEEIKKYKNEKSHFLDQDKKIMEINRNFFEKFNIGFDDFLNDFLALSNNQEKFIMMAEYYLTIADEIKETILDTDYSFPFGLLLEKSLIKGFAAFIKKDKKVIEHCISELNEQGKKEFENNIKGEIALSRENIIKNNKKFLREEVAKLKPKRFDSFIQRVDAYSPEQIKNFLSDIVNYLEENLHDTENTEIDIFTAITKNMLKKADEIPYMEAVQEQQKNYGYIPAEFYDYLNVDDAVYDMMVFLSAASFLISKNHNAAYELLKESMIEKTESFDMMFLTGKIFSFFDNKKHKRYFNEAKRIDKKRYKIELKDFLDEKERKILTL